MLSLASPTFRTLRRAHVTGAFSTAMSDFSKMTDLELTESLKAMQAEKRRRQSTLIIGAAGAIGKRLCGALTARGHRVIATDRMEKLPGSVQREMGKLGKCIGSVDVRDAEGLKALFREHADANTTVWNLAAPLSVETALSPEVAEAVTVGGMSNVLAAMSDVGARRICFTDSIGSFGASAPRKGATARWLIENPTQDPGSDYGRQKRGCRELMATFMAAGGDSRFAVLPGVLHDNPVWGNGTTEYALDALIAAPHQASKHGLPTGSAYVCPVDPDVKLPMVFSTDLMRGLVALQEADEDSLAEPERGYCIPGLSFTPNELFAEIRKHHPGFGFRVKLNEVRVAVHSPAFLSPLVAATSLTVSTASLSEHEQVCQPVAGRARPVGTATRSWLCPRGRQLPSTTTNTCKRTLLLGGRGQAALHSDPLCTPSTSLRQKVKLADMVTKVLAGHEERNLCAAAAFKAIDIDGTNTLDHAKLEKHIREHLVRGREGYKNTAQSAVGSLCDLLMDELDTDKDGFISWTTFSEWNRSNSIEKVLMTTSLSESFSRAHVPQINVRPGP